MRVLHVATGSGPFRILLDDAHAPDTCAYFIGMVNDGRLSPASVFRVLSERNQHEDEPFKISVVQLGTPKGLDATRSRITHEHTRRTGLKHQRWTVSAARFEPGEVYGSFFVCMRDEPELDHGGSRQEDGEGFAAFGRVVEGFDTLRRLHALAESNDLLTESVAVTDVQVEIAPPDRLHRWQLQHQH